MIGVEKQHRWVWLTEEDPIVAGESILSMDTVREHGCRNAGGPAAFGLEGGERVSGEIGVGKEGHRGKSGPYGEG